MRATWLTDLHLNFLRPLALKQFHQTVAAERPDVLLVTGDTAEAHSLGDFLAELAAAARAPAYFVMGNHDYYRSTIDAVRHEVAPAIPHATWLPARAPIPLTARCVLVGVDGWGDARCGDLASTVQLSDWKLIGEFEACLYDRPARAELLRALGEREAAALAAQLASDTARAARELLVLTHVPPFPEACVYAGRIADPAWLPWFTCVATGEVLRAHARAHPAQQITVLCGHAHGVGTFAAEANLIVRTGGWPAGVEGYGNPIVQATLELL